MNHRPEMPDVTIPRHNVTLKHPGRSALWHRTDSLRSVVSMPLIAGGLFNLKWEIAEEVVRWKFLCP